MTSPQLSSPQPSSPQPPSRSPSFRSPSSPLPSSWSPSSPSFVTTVVRSIVAALAVLLPTECVACGALDWAVCPVCAEAMRLGAMKPDAMRPGEDVGAGVGAGADSHAGAGVGSRSVSLVIEAGRAPPLPVWASLPYETTVKTALSALKESGRTDAARPLARVLQVAVEDARASLAPRLPPGALLELTIAPSSRAAFRVRGYHPVLLLARRVRGNSPVVSTLRVARATADQAGLGMLARQANLSGSLKVRRKFQARLSGRHFLLIDDVVTTGSTLLESRRALECAGATVWGAATLAFARKHTGASAVHPAGEP